MPLESALVVLIPEAEDLVGCFRDRFDPSAAAGVPAHVTLLYPFKAPAELTPAVAESLTQIFSTVRPFEISLAQVKTFPTVLYLAPHPDEDLRRLTRTIVKQFPETPPYGGEFDDVIPHLTVAQADDAQHLATIAADFESKAKDKLPIRSTVSEVCLIDNSSGRWRTRHRFALADRDPLAKT